MTFTVSYWEPAGFSPLLLSKEEKPTIPEAVMVKLLGYSVS